MMNLEYDVSIIIPAYNSKDTIDITLKSIKNQNFRSLFEVIIVNDCSDYTYKEFIDKYKKYFIIREIKTKVNSGPGVARQLGIDRSNSKYIIFIDDDDYLYDEESLSKMYEKIENEKLDLLICDFICEKDNNYRIITEDSNWLHGKIYKRNFLNKYNIRFNNTRANEDNGFNKLILLLHPKYSILKELVYVYKENLNSITLKNNEIYKFNGLEGFCYNMNWAMEEALNRKQNIEEISFLSLDVLCAIYIYYVNFYYQFDVKKILIWGKPIFNIYKRYHKAQFSLVSKILENKKKQLKNICSKRIYNISFEAFLSKFEN